MFLKKVLPLAAVMSAALLTACGGGGGSDDTPAQPQNIAGPEGLYRGKAGTRDVVALVLDDGRIYSIYSVAGNPNLGGGVIVGRGSASNGTYTTTVLKDFSVEAEQIASGQITATYSPKASINGTVTYTTAGFTNATFTATYSTDYDLVPNLAAVAGTYTGGVATSEGSFGEGTVTITASGALSSSQPGCSTTGTLTPRSKGNVFDVSLTSTGVDCEFPGVNLSGIATYNAAQKGLVVIAHDSAITKGLLAVGTKP